uniref:amidohydrolase family protein n=1 Tax=Shimia sp. TaxID=1954381 RepID=UPI0035636D61
ACGGTEPETAMAMATRIPAELIGRADIGRLAPGCRADLLHLDAEGRLRRVWQGGRPVG